MNLAQLTLVINSGQASQANNNLRQLNLTANQTVLVSNRITNSFRQQSAAARSLGSDYSRLLGYLGSIVSLYGAWRLVTKTLEAGAGMQKTLAAYETMTGSMQLAIDLQNEFVRISASSGFRLDAINEAGKLYLALGGDARRAAQDINTITEAVTAMGGSAESVRRIALALGQMKAKEFVSGEEVRQLANANVRVWDYLTKKFQIDIPTAMYMAEHKLLDVNKAIEGIMEGLKEDFEGAFEKRAKTAGGAWDILVAKIRQSQAQIGMQILNTPGLAEEINRLSEWAQKFGRVLEEVIRVFQGLLPKYPELREQAETAATAIKALTAGFVSFLALELATKISKVTFAVRGLTLALLANPLTLIFTVISAGIAGLVVLWDKYRDKLIEIGGTTASLGDFAQATFEEIGRLLGIVIETWANRVRVFFQWIETGLNGIFLFFGTSAGQAFDGFLIALKAVINFVISSLLNIIDVIKFVFKSLVELATAAFDSIKAPFTAMADAMSALFSTDWTSLQSIKKTSQEITQIFSMSSQDIVNNFNKAFDQVGKNAIQLGNEIIQNTTKDHVGALPELLQIFKEASIDPFNILGLKDETLQNIGENILKRAAELRKAREEAEKLAQAVTDGALEGAEATDKATESVKAFTEEQLKAIDAAQQMFDKLYSRQQSALQIDKNVRRNMDAADQLDKILKKAGLEFGTDEEPTILKVRYEIDIRRAMGQSDEDIRRHLQDQLAQYQNYIEQLEERAKEIDRTAEGIGDSFSNAFNDIVFGAKSASEALEDFARSVSRLIFNQMVTQPLANALTGFATNFMNGIIPMPAAPAPTPPPIPSAKGNIFGHGQIIPFAKGGLMDLITQPTLFPMRSGRTGLMGEDGEEAVMPLKRDRFGRLAVSGGGSTTVYNNHFNISTPDADSFRRSESQIGRKLRGR